MGKHTGFVAYLRDGRTIFEKNNCLCSNGGMRATDVTIKATNWCDVPNGDIVTLALYWKGKLVLSLDECDLYPLEWLFSHTASYAVSNGNKGSQRLISRNIGYKKDGQISMYKCLEETGEMDFSYTDVK